jgi:o-succinylbenzoate synthase
MIITEIKYKPFRIKLVKQFLSSNQTLSERKGFYLTVIDEFNNQSTGEVITLPGISGENLHESELEILKIMGQFKEKKLNLNFKTIKNEIQNLALFPSVQFGFEQALIGLMYKNKFADFNKYFPVTKKVINVNAVIGLDSKVEIINQAKNYLEKGFTTFKVKVGRKNFSDDLHIIESLRKEFGFNFNLRIDVNGSWKLEDAIQYIKELKKYQIEFIEDPCSNLECLERIVKESPIPITVDQFIDSHSTLNRLINQNKFQFLVIKPIVLGSIFKLMDLIEAANQRKINLVISSGFESSLGRSMVVLISSLVNHSYAHGLATSSYFEKSNQIDAHNITNGKIEFDLKNHFAEVMA